MGIVLACALFTIRRPITEGLDMKKHEILGYRHVRERDRRRACEVARLRGCLP